ncbi:MAG: DUF4160 domain-containing protein [Rhodothermales bacterium]
MPNLSEYLLFRFGIAVRMYYGDKGQHNLPHVHVVYQGEEATVAIPSGELLGGEVDRKALRKARAWITLNEEAIMERWEKAARDIHITRID